MPGDRATGRPGDLVGRFGGEEFVVVLPETDARGAVVLAWRMRQALLDANMPHEPGKPEVLSMAFGVTSARGKEIESASGMIRLG